MRALFTVLAKEFRDNLRDRRTLLSALLFGPLFGPLLFGFMVSRMLEQSVAEPDQPLKVTLACGERAPGLVRFLDTQAVVVTRQAWTEEQARAAVHGGKADVVLLVPAEFAARFATGRPAALLLFADSSDSQARRHVDRLRALLGAYSGSVAQLRLQARGVDPLVTLPIAVNEVDVATPAGRAVVVLGFMTYFVLFAVLMGGLYLAIDTTAGERERGSLEPLLCLPVARSSLVGGKLLATSAYMCLSMALSLGAFVVVFAFVPLERLGMSANLKPWVALELFCICLPFVPLGAGLMTFVASFTKSYREAQTYLALVLLVPTMPIIFASVYSLKTRSSLMFIPSLSQHLLMTSVLKDDPVSWQDLGVSAAASLALAAVFAGLTVRHWRREALLG